ncbi:MAG: tRNA pseudouridine(38-40) synthase TruA [Alphaproteobacteria bacterium]|nr:tRNA pseudouridine(38-40) synthase TruA [Alphaproteobacteria bacterium]
MSRYKINLEYDGTNLIGWQENRQGPSVQSLLKDALEKFCGARPDIVGAGRTDAGVHAVCMTAHVDIDGDFSANTVMRALNFYLKGKPVCVLSCDIVSDNFHARFDCVARHYKYIVLNRASVPVLQNNRVYWVRRPLDVGAMRAAAARLIGCHDFTSFRASECQAKSPIKTLDKISVTQNKDEIIFEVSARSFLHHMVRNIVGTLVEIGLGKSYDIDAILDAKNRSAAGPTAPASGLYFIHADYMSNDVCAANN